MSCLLKIIKHIPSNLAESLLTSPELGDWILSHLVAFWPQLKTTL